MRWHYTRVTKTSCMMLFSLSFSLVPSHDNNIILLRTRTAITLYCRSITTFVNLHIYIYTHLNLVRIIRGIWNFDFWIFDGVPLLERNITLYNSLKSSRSTVSKTKIISIRAGYTSNDIHTSIVVGPSKLRFLLKYYNVRF